MDRIGASVGTGSLDRKDDVLLVQQLLKRHERWLRPLSAPPPTGSFTPEMDRAIRAFQLSAAALERADGVVSPSGYTFKALSRVAIPGPQHRVFSPVCWYRGTSKVTEQSYADAAKTLGVEVAAIKAVTRTELETTAMWDDVGRPRILFERHLFRKHTGGIYNRSHHDISGPQGAYGKFSAQYPKLYRAAMLNEDAALMSASWGAYQILGENYKEAGFSSVAAMVDAMLEDDLRHLQAFVAYVKARPSLNKAMRDHDWTTFARGYNGPGYKQNTYDTRMAKHFAELSPPAKAK